jgi:hypothetical protein
MLFGTQKSIWTTKKTYEADSMSMDNLFQKKLRTKSPLNLEHVQPNSSKPKRKRNSSVSSSDGSEASPDQSDQDVESSSSHE